MLTVTTIDLTDYVIGKTGHWFENPEHLTPTLLKLTAPDDGLTLAGPMRVRVSVQAENRFQLVGSLGSVITSKELFGYVLDIPPGQTWTYPAPRSQLFAGDARIKIPEPKGTGEPGVGGTPAGARPPTTSAVPPIIEPFPGFVVGGVPGLGTNAGLSVVIRPAGYDACTDPCVSVDPDPCAPRRQKECSCHSKPCHCYAGEDDIPCDVAVGNIPNLGTFFPAACEPCAPGASIGAPTLRGPSLMVRPANGGTVRARYYNGMFITREDLETDQRNVRLKRALMNRAMGQGVVWGLNVCLDGDSVCVMPGYGVDCCGNDLIVTTPYRVDGVALLRDPAAAPLLSKRAPQRLHLVLEYFECPEQPRPVHGDPCSPDTTRCETSRVRETTRLRLAPPCEIDDSGPIKDFLREMEALKTDPVVGPLLAQPAPQPAPSPALQVPFDVTVTVLRTNTSIVLAPKVTTDPIPNRVRADLDITNDAEFLITLRPRPGFQFVSGSTVEVKRLVNGVPTDVNAPFMPDVSTPTEISWRKEMAAVLPRTIPVAGSEPIVVAAAYQLQNWKLRDANGVEIEAVATEIQLTRVVPDEWRSTPWGQSNPAALPNARSGLHVQIPPTAARVIGRPPQIPCFSEACDPEGRPRFPVLPPWLHEDPTQPSTAADPKVIVLAIVYAWLAMIMTRDRIGTPNAINTGQFTLAVAIYRSVWKLFFATEPDTDRYHLTDALQRLLQAWCRALLYPGPKCLCEPHGVVIGCTTVSAGTIQNVDPWGGRRWVVHYPLLAYWGQQFGIMPLDAIASKLFDFLCCVAHLPAPRVPRRDSRIAVPFTEAAFPGQPEVGRASSVNLGRAMLFLGNERETEARMKTFGIRPTRVVSVNPIDFVTCFIDALRPPAQPGERPLVRYTVAGLPDLHLVAPGDVVEVPAPRPTEPGRLREVVRASFARRAERATVPPLLADFAEDLTRDLLTRLSVQPTADAEKPVVDRLADAGVTTVGGLLGCSPTEVHERVLGRENAAELASIIEAGEQTARSVSKAVGDAVVAAAADRRVVARTDVKSPEAVADLMRRLEDKLKATKIAVSTEALAAAINTAAGED